MRHAVQVLTAGTITLVAAFAPTLGRAETFKYGSFVPERSSANRAGVFPMMEKIEKATDGRVKFDRLVGGTVLSAPNSLRGVRDKVVDVAFVVPQFHISELPHASLMAELTGLGTDTFATLGALNEIFYLHCPACREDLQKQGVAPLFLQSATPLTMACTKPVKSAEDIKGLRLSATGTPEMRWGTMLKMTPRRQTFAEFVQALQLGQSDCVAAPISWIKSYGLTDVIKSVIEMPQGVITGAMPFLFNQDALAKISADDRKTINRMMPGMLYDYVNAAYGVEDDVVKKEMSGRTAFEPGDAAMTALWNEYQVKEAEALTELAARRNLPDAKASVAKMVEVFKKWHVQHLPKFKGNRDAFADVLWNEVFSKVSY